MFTYYELGYFCQEQAMNLLVPDQVGKISGAYQGPIPLVREASTAKWWHFLHWCVVNLFFFLDLKLMKFDFLSSKGGDNKTGGKCQGFHVEVSASRNGALRGLSKYP